MTIESDIEREPEELLVKSPVFGGTKVALEMSLADLLRGKRTAGYEVGERDWSAAGGVQEGGGWPGCGV